MKNLLVVIFVFFPVWLFSQIGGNAVYEFLTIPVSPRAAALGGSAMAINDDDISLANENPALLTPGTDGKLALDFINYIGDINLGYTSYAKHIDKLGTFGVGVQYLNGGEFIQADELGYHLGTFTVNELAVNLTYAKTFDSLFTIGSTIKPVYSQLDQYKSFGLLMDIGAVYNFNNGLTSVSLLLRNFGAQITTYNQETENVPFEIQAGIATKLKHAPFRFSAVIHNLETPRLTYSQTNFAEPLNVEQDKELNEGTVFEDVMSHMIVGVEFTPTKNFFIRGGYNYQRRQELKLDNKPGMVGFSWGFGFRIAKLHLSYANVRYHMAGVSNQFAITTNLSDYFK